MLGHRRYPALLTSSAIRIFGAGLSGVLQLASVAVLVRYLGMAGFGTYTAVMALIAIAIHASDFGIGPAVVVSGGALGRRTVFAGALRAAVAFTLAAWAAATALCLTTMSTEARRLWFVAVPYFLAVRVVAFVVPFRELELAPLRIAVADAVGRAATLSAAIGIAATFVDAALATRTVLAMTATAIGPLATALVLVPPTHAARYATTLRRVPHEATAAQQGSASIVPLAARFGLVSALSAVHVRLDQVILDAFAASGLGSYAIGYRVIEGAKGLLGGVMSFVFAALSRSAADDRVRLLQQFLRLLTLAAVASAVAIYWLAPWLMNVLSGSQDRDGVLLLKILSAVLLVSLLNVGPGLVAMVAKRTRPLILIASSGVTLNVVLNLVFVPRYGALAAAITTLVTEGAGFCAIAWLASHDIEGVRFVRYASVAAFVYVLLTVAISWSV